MDESIETSETLNSSSVSDAPVVCQLLRTKTAFGTFAGSLYSWQTGNSTTAVYWCLRTMETAGPDDGYAHPHACCEGRACFEKADEE
jgi:hypothetical protein